MQIIFNHEKLEGRINDMFGSKEAFGKIIGMSSKKINSRLKGSTEFTMGEITKSVEVLKIDPIEIDEYFFNTKVCNA